MRTGFILANMAYRINLRKPDGKIRAVLAQMTSKLNLHGNTVLANPDKLILTLTSRTGYKREILYLHQEPVTANITEHNEASPEKNGLVQSIQRLVSIS